MLDLIDRVGPGGEYISAKETAKHFRKEIWLPRLLDRQPWNQWERNGAPTMLDNIRERICNILETHQPYPLPDGALEKINAILEKK
jgi:trimethylamine--corrinoid protein Co-methyltransferase